MAKNILVTGATGKQGGALIEALANNPAFTLLAHTRIATGSGAQKLTSQGSNIKVVEGDQEDVPGLFKNAQKAANGEIWGVYSVQISQGKGVTHDGEIKQGKAMVDEAVKAGVKHFVYSSVERGGDEESWNNKTPIPHFESKYQIEHHLKEKAGSMGWTILRPGMSCGMMPVWLSANASQWLSWTTSPQVSQHKSSWRLCVTLSAPSRTSGSQPLTSESLPSSLSRARTNLTTRLLVLQVTSSHPPS